MVAVIFGEWGRDGGEVLEEGQHPVRLVNGRHTS